MCKLVMDADDATLMLNIIMRVGLVMRANVFSL